MLSRAHCPRRSLRLTLALLAILEGGDGATLKGCSDTAVSAGSSFRWPTANPAMVAPKMVSYNFPVYGDPLLSEFTGTSLSIEMPSRFTGGFTLQTYADGSNWTNGETGANETYVLRKIEVRNPGRAPAGIGQALPHTLEVALLHQQVGGSYWANVIVPIEVSGQSDYDVLAPIVAGEPTLPTLKGQRAPVLLSSAQKLDLNAFFGNVTFQHFWTTLPTSCESQKMNARQLMRARTLNTGINTFEALFKSLDNAPRAPPILPPSKTWTVNVCSAQGTCTNQAATPIASKISQAQTIQTQAVTEFRERKQLMDQALSKLVGNASGTQSTGSGSLVSTTGQPASASSSLGDLMSQPAATSQSDGPVGALQTAISAKADLQSAEQEMNSITAYLNQLQGWYNQTSKVRWDDDAPVQSTTTATTQNPSGNSTASASANTSSANVTTVSFLAAATVTGQRDDCRDLRLSPVDINTTRVVDPGIISSELREPILFLQGAASVRSQLRVQMLGGRMRISPMIHRATPFGELVAGGERRPVTYIDVLTPGEHAVDGRVGAAELQLVSEPASDNGVTLALSLRLDVGDRENSWLASVINDQTPNAPLPPLSELHQAYSRRSSDKYFRYDGSLTSPPCAATQWFVMDEPGPITAPQLKSLLISIGGPDAQLPRRFRAALVAFGTPRLVTGLSGTKSNSGLRGKIKGRRIAI